MFFEFFNNDFPNFFVYLLEFYHRENTIELESHRQTFDLSCQRQIKWVCQAIERQLI